MTVVAPPPHDESELLIREARARQRKRRASAVALVAVFAGVALAVFSIIGATTRSTSSGGSQRSGTATASRCGVQVKGVRIFQGRQLVFREPVSRTFGHQIECSGSSVWVVFFNGVGSSQEAYYGVHSADRGRNWNVIFAERYFDVKAPHQLVTGYLGAWTLDGPRAAYFVGECVACGAGIVSLWVTRDAGRTFHRYAVPWPKGARSASVRLPGHTVTISAHHIQVS